MYVLAGPPGVEGDSVPCKGCVTIVYVSGSLLASVAVRVIGFAVFLLTVTVCGFATGAEFPAFVILKLSSIALLPFL